MLAVGVGLQVAWPHVDGDPSSGGDALDALTVTTVLVMVAALVTWVTAVRGAAAGLAVLGVPVVVGLAVELLGTTTGLPFGEYAYADSLGVRVGEVPVLIGAAWALLAWPATAGARLVTSSRVGVAALVAVALVGWDLALDPQMIAAGHWSWADPTPALPGIPEVPLQNYAGWAAVGAVLGASLDRLVPRGAPDGADERVAEALPLVLLLWTWIGVVVLFAFYEDRPAVAAWSGAVLGVLVLPALAAAVRRRHVRAAGRGPARAAARR